jgi:hypothetical protein
VQSGIFSCGVPTKWKVGNGVSRGKKGEELSKCINIYLRDCRASLIVIVIIMIIIILNTQDINFSHATNNK